jgi:hypothetical protein
VFIGHFAVAFAVKKAAPKVSLGTLLMATQFVDLLWPIFLLLGLEHVRIAPGVTAFTPLDFYDYPLTHSLLTGVEWGLVFGGVYYTAFSKDLRAAIILAACVASHWVLDFVSHRADLPILPWSDYKVGLGLWNSIPATLAIEMILFSVGVWLYLQTTKATNTKGMWGMWSFLVFAVIAYLGAVFGPPPPNVNALTWSALSVWLLVAWMHWFDGNRTSVDQPIKDRLD